MNTELLEDILSCPTLPSLPAIAVQVIELTGDPNVSMDDLANLVQTDQAMAARILRTVNSSFYGLRERCTTIRKALVMLGLSPVKSLVLGFSLVNSIGADEESGFDYEAYWRRGLYTAAAAKAVADAAKIPNADECFLSGLLQDIGMIALFRTLGDAYLDVIWDTGGSHAKLVQCELETLEVQHPDIGATLAGRWRLPDELTVPIKYHERPSAAPKEHQVIARAVAIGNLAHDVLTVEDRNRPLKQYYARCKQWFGLSEAEAEAAFRRFSDATEELADLFNLDIGNATPAEELLRQAEVNLLKIAEEEPHVVVRVDHLENLLVGEEMNDPLTGLLNARGFESAMGSTFSTLQGTGVPVTLAQVVLDGLKPIQEAAGVLASDAVLIRAVAFLQQSFEPMGGIVCRGGSSIISVILPNTDGKHAAAAFEQFRLRFDSSVATLLETAGVERTVLKTSVGTATTTMSDAAAIRTHEGLISAATRAVQAARQAGGDCLRAFAARSAA